MCSIDMSSSLHDSHQQIFVGRFDILKIRSNMHKTYKLHEYDEIILIGSGKGVASVNTIKDIKWKRRSLKYFKIFSNFYKTEIKKCSIYK